MKLKTQQPPMSVDEQIKNLKSIGLIINDEALAYEFLNDVSYFRLIKAFSLGLKEKNGFYDEGVTIEHIIELYLFNCNFRQLLFSQIEKIEVNLRCRIANYFSAKYGVLGYEYEANFENKEYHDALLKDIVLEIERNRKSPFVKNFMINYQEGKIPFYALIELFSFGTLSKFYKNMKSDDKKAISSSYKIGYTYLESWIESIAYVRNVCAHYGRLYNAKLAKTPILYKQYAKDGIRNNRIFAVILCMKRMIKNDRHWIDFVDSIQNLFDKYDHVDKRTMGFSDNWEELLLE